MANLTYSIATRLDKGVHEALIRAAAADDRKLSAFIARILAQWVKENCPQPDPATDSDETAATTTEEKPVTDWIDQPVKPRKRKIKSNNT